MKKAGSKTKAAVLLFPLLLTGCATGRPPPIPGGVKAPWDEWYFTFTTPKALPAQVTQVNMLDMNRHGYVFRTIDQPQGSSVGTWGKYIGKGVATFNRAKVPPWIMVFCWDSIIDKKVYETTLYFSEETQQKMLSSEPRWHNPEEPYYFRYLVIGLAPEGKVRVWLKNNGDPNLLQSSTEIVTVSGEKLDTCRGVTNFTHGYEYSENMKAFIKGKQYPYGIW